RVIEWDLPTLGKNLFIDLMQRISSELNVSKCWICEGPQMTEQWSWRGEGVTPQQLLQWNHTRRSAVIRPEGWILSGETVGQICISREG
ncbi:ENR1 protein, partial [Smithornis capensis]|nr:ENR1 protein [Smithornis capensis]